MNPVEEVLFREFPALKSGVEEGALRVTAHGNKLRIELISHRHLVTKSADSGYLAIDSKTGKHDKEFVKRQERWDDLSEHINKDPAIQEAMRKHGSWIPQDDRMFDGLGDVRRYEPF